MGFKQSKNMSDMFQYCNQDISSWNTVSVEDVRNIFYECGIKKSHKPKMLLETFYDDGYKINHNLTDEQKDKITEYVDIYNEAHKKARNDSLKQLLCCYGKNLKHYKPKKISLMDEANDCFDSIDDYEVEFRKKKLSSKLRRTFYHTLFSIFGLREYENDDIESKFYIFRRKFEDKFFPNILSEIIKQMENEDEKYKDALSKLKDFIQDIQDNKYKRTKEAFEAIDEHIGIPIGVGYFPRTNKEIRKFHKLYKELEISVDGYEGYINSNIGINYKAFL